MKTKYSLILDDEFIQYCDLNNISDIEGFAKKVFNKGFTLIKYGDIVLTKKTETVAKELIPVMPLSSPDPTGIISKMDRKPENVKKTDKVYDE